MKKIFIQIVILFPLLTFSQVIVSGNGKMVQKGKVNIFLEGDFINNAGDLGYIGSQNDGTIVFASSHIQKIDGNFSTSFTNIELNNSSGLDINKTITANNLTLTQGIINTSPSKLVNIISGGSVHGASSTRYINGPMAKTGNEDFLFDVGNAGKYAPVKITNLSLNTIIVADYTHSVAPNPNNLTSPLQRVSHVEYWNINDSNQLGATANVELFWENADTSGIKSINPDTLKFVSYEASSWLASGQTIINGALGGASGSIVSLNPINLLSRNLTFGTTDKTNNPLPITLISFTANCLSHGIELDWSTAAEFNDDYFTILRSSSIDNYKEVGVVTGAGNSDQVLNYSFTDWSATHDNFYYTLEQTDYDGTHKYYHPIEIDCKYTNHAKTSVYPNPTKGIVYLNGDEIEIKQLKVYNILGQDISGQVLFISQNSTTKSLDLSKLENGYYTIKSKTLTHKICKQ